MLVDHPLLGEVCPVLAVITEISSYEEVAGSSISENKMGKLLATSEIVGYVDLRNENRPIQEVLIPPNPGCRVYIPLKKFLEDTLNRNTNGEVFKVPLQIGMFEASSTDDREKNGQIKCFMDAQDFTSKHSIITAVAGSGKTYTAKLLVHEISGKTPAQIIVFDPYNEYSSGLIISAKKVDLNIKTDKDSLAKEIKKNPITILNAQGLKLEEKRSFYNESLQTLLKLRLEEKIKPIFLLIEEAENLKGPILEEVIAQGRKIGIYVCLLTTQPAELGGKIISQAGCQIMGKTTNKEDIECLENMGGAANTLPGLGLGEWIINGISTNRPMKIQVKGN